MSGNFLADDDEPFQDIPEEVQEGQHAPVPQVRTARPAVPPPVQAQPEPEVYEEESVEQTAEQEEEDFSSVLTEARFKLELGRLYEMLMNHDIFSGSDADAKAIKYVTKQVRNFAKEQMEIMLGMRQVAVAEPTVIQAEFPFNDLEVQVLKAMARTATKGATESAEAQTFTATVPQQPQARATLNPIGLKPAAPKMAQVQPRPVARPVAAQKPAAKPLPKGPAAPIRRDPRTEAQIDQILAEEGISREEYERQYNPSYKPLGKPLSQLTENEMIERNKQARTRRATNPAAIPMPTAEQEEMIHTQRAQAANSNPQMMSIMNLLMAQPKK